MCIQADAERALSGVITETDRGPVITFTIEDQDSVMTVEEVGKITSSEFQRLYSVCLACNRLHNNSVPKSCSAHSKLLSV